MEPTTRSMKTSVDLDAMNQLPETSPIWRRVRAIVDRHGALDRLAEEAVSLAVQKPAGRISCRRHASRLCTRALSPMGALAESCKIRGIQ